MTKVRIPQIVNLQTAIRLYYERIELSSKDIKNLFGNTVSSSTITRLKSLARETMIEDNTPVWNATNVNTRVAYKSWGIDINDLEERFNKLKQLGMI